MAFVSSPSSSRNSSSQSISSAASTCSTLISAPSSFSSKVNTSTSTLLPFSSCSSTRSHPIPITLPIITLILHLPSTSETYTRHLDFSTYRTWTHFASLLSIFSDDLGIVCLWIWDVVEKMEVGPGDWEARVRPGWRVDVVCCMMGEMGDDEDDGFDEADWEHGVGYWCDDVAGVQWGFARWRRQVERGNGRVTGRGKRGYVIGIVGLVWVLAMIWGLVLWG